MSGWVGEVLERLQQALLDVTVDALTAMKDALLILTAEVELLHAKLIAAIEREAEAD